MNKFHPLHVEIPRREHLIGQMEAKNNGLIESVTRTVFREGYFIQQICDVITQRRGKGYWTDKNQRTTMWS